MKSSCTKRYGEYSIYCYRHIDFKFLVVSWLIGKNYNDEPYYKSIDLTLGVRPKHYIRPWAEFCSEFNLRENLFAKGNVHFPRFIISFAFGFLYIKIRVRRNFIDVDIY